MGTHRIHDMGRRSFFSSAPKQSQPVAVEYSAIRGVPYYQAYQPYQPPPPYQYQHVASQIATTKKKPQPPRLSPLMIPIQPGPKPICISQPKPQPQQRQQQPQQQQQQQQWLGQGLSHQQRPQSYQPPRQQQHHAVPASLAVPRPLSHLPKERLRSAQQPQPEAVAAPTRAPPNLPKVAAKVEDDIDFFEFQYPCMLPPETISLGPRPVSDPVTSEVTPSAPSPRLSLPVLPSESPHTPALQRSKPYLQSRRQRMPTRDSIRPLRTRTRDDLHGVAPAAQTVFSLERPARKDSGQWYDFVEETGNAARSAGSGDSTPTPIARPETPLEYRAQQAAALHDLLGQVLGDDTTTTAADKKEAAMTASPLWSDSGITILEEEVELAAKGYRKFSAEEYMRELREVLNSFDSPI